MLNIARMSRESEQTILEQMQINRESAHSFGYTVRLTGLTLCDSWDEQMPRWRMLSRLSFGF